MDSARTQFKRSDAVKAAVIRATAGPVFAGAPVRGAGLNAADRITRPAACLRILGCTAAPVLSWRHTPAAGR